MLFKCNIKVSKAKKIIIHMEKTKPLKYGKIIQICCIVSKNGPKSIKQFNYQYIQK